jgi:hypothetical protein
MIEATGGDHTEEQAFRMDNKGGSRDSLHSLMQPKESFIDCCRRYSPVHCAAVALLHVKPPMLGQF